ncbi:hypothetical protein PVAG01_01756 [Phlyctema vagabunda]|uniref:Uncharacterized protein n=1 Tax=Phlyctema vagabunda TaxID=108571 RepID=A0ABR4PXZ1_9HELO
MQATQRIRRKPVPQTSLTDELEVPPRNLPTLSPSESTTFSQEVFQELDNGSIELSSDQFSRPNSASIVSILTSDGMRSEEPEQDANVANSDGALEDSGQDQSDQVIQHQQNDQRVEKTPNVFLVAKPSSDSHEDKFQYWDPVYLQLASLLAYAICLCLLAIALIVLLVISNKNSGLSTANRSYSYGWTYAPTAVFILLSVPWKRVDYLCKILTPWHNMKTAPQKANRSITLDTISPTLPEGILSAYKHRHWSLLATIIGTVILSLMAVFSTGLFVLQPTRLIKANVAMQTTSFWNASLSTTDTAAISYYGIHNAGLPPPAWTLDYAAVQPFSAINGGEALNISSMTASVLVFYPSFTCEEATWDISTFDSTTGMYNATFTTNTCRASQDNLYSIDGTQVFAFQTSGFPNDNYASTFEPVSCSDDDILDHVLLAVSHATEANGEIGIAEMGAVICRPDYSITTSRVTFSPALPTRQKKLEIEREANEERLAISGFGSSDLSVAVRGSTQSLFLQSTNTDEISENTDSFFTLMAHNIGPVVGNSTLKPLLDTAVLVTQAEKVFVGVAAQLASQSLLAPRMSKITGSIDYEETRLHVHQTTVILLVLLLALLIISTIAVLFTRPIKVVPRDPATISGLLILLRKSELLQGLLRDTGFLRSSALENVLENNSYSTELMTPDSEEQQFLICVNPTEVEMRESTKEYKKPTNKWWRPMGSLTWFKLLSIALPATLIISLEVIQQLSDRRNGFVTINRNTNTTVFGTKYIPAAVMFVISLLHGTLYSTAAVFAPYQTLRKPGASTSRTITVNHLSSVPLATVWTATKIRHWPVVATSISVVVSAFLTIFVANLYTVSAVAGTRDITLQRIDEFDLAWNNSYSNDNKAGSFGNLIEYWNITYPQWTYEDLVFPKISLETGPVYSAGDSVKLTIPAYRGVLNCTETPVDETIVTVDPDVRFDPINITGILRNTCPGGERQDMPYSISALQTLGGSLFGTMDYIHFTNGASLEVGEPGMGFVGGFQPPDNDLGCPSLAFGFGEYLDGDSTQATASTFTCTQLIQEVMTEALFSLPSFSLDLTDPPRRNESTARFVSDDAGNLIREYQHTATLAQYFYNESAASFFDIVLHGRDKHEPTGLLGESNVGSLINASARVYGRYMAQTISLNMRTESPAPTTVAGLLQQRNQLKVHQNRVSKITLQVCLGLMVSCAAAYWILMDTKELLPRNPSSIASVASWLTGNSLWENDRIVGPVETVSDKELQHDNRLGKTKFAFGCWGDSEIVNPDKRFGIDVVSE